MKRHRLIFLFMLEILLVALVFAQEQNKSERRFDHSVYADVLEKYVDDMGNVNYKELKANPEQLNQYLKQIAGLDENKYDLWDDNTKIAFWLNAYNAFTLKVVIDHYPIKPAGFNRWVYPKNSIRQIPGVWDKIRFGAVHKEYTLEQIEHEILRKEFNEPLIHMALVCASVGCPQLRNVPYGDTTSKTPGPLLAEQLRNQATRFLSSPNKFHADVSRKTLSVSPILKWFAEDFVPEEQRKKMTKAEIERQAVLTFVSNHIGTGMQEFHSLESKEWRIQYLDYDWSLNGQQN